MWRHKGQVEAILLPKQTSLYHLSFTIFGIIFFTAFCGLELLNLALVPYSNTMKTRCSVSLQAQGQAHKRHSAISCEMERKRKLATLRNEKLTGSKFSEIQKIWPRLVESFIQQVAIQIKINYITLIPRYVYIFTFYVSEFATHILINSMFEFNWYLLFYLDGK